MYILIPLGVISMAGVIFLAVSKKSGFKLRVAAIAALALMIITVIICLVQIFGVPVASVLPANLDQQTTNATPVQNSNSGVLILVVIMLLAIFLLVVIFSIREHKQAAKARLKIKIDSDLD